MKLLNTNSGIYKNAINQYLLNGIEFEGTDKEKINYVFECFISEYWHDYNKKYYNNNVQTGLKNWLMGLPSAIYVSFYNHEILEVTKMLHNVTELTEDQEITILQNWFSHIAFKLIQLKMTLNK